MNLVDRFFLEHKFTHKSNKTMKCEFPGCNYSAAYKTLLKNHSRVHERNKQYRCESCEFATHRQDSLKLQHGAHTKNLEWSTCGKKYKFESSLRAHEKIHKTDLFECDFLECKYRTGVLTNLTDHKKKHSILKVDPDQE